MDSFFVHEKRTALIPRIFSAINEKLYFENSFASHSHSFSFFFFLLILSQMSRPKCLERVLRTRFATLYSPTCDFRNRGNSRINRLWQNYRRRISGNFKLAFPVWNRSLIEDGSHYRFSHTKFDGPLLDGHGKGIMDKVVT